MNPVPRIPRRLRAALFVALVVAAGPVTAIQGGWEVLSGPENESDALVASLQRPGSSLLQNLSREVGIGGIGASMSPAPSHVLGLAAAPNELPLLYEAHARASATPLRDAVNKWSSFLEAEAPDPEGALLAADLYDRETQIAIAILLYALTDASNLQKEAVAGLEPEEYAELLRAPLEILETGFAENGAPRDAEIMERHARLATLVDMDLINAGAQIIVASQEHVRSALQEWAARERLAQDLDDPRIDHMNALRAGYADLDPAEMAPAERIGLAADAVRAAGAMAGTDVPLLATEPIRPSGSNPLRDAIRASVDTLGVHVSPGLLEEELAQADALPLDVQEAIALIVVNHASWRTTLGTSDVLEADAAAAAQVGRHEMLAATLRLLAAAEEAASVLGPLAADQQSMQAASGPVGPQPASSHGCPDDDDGYPAEVEELIGTDPCDGDDYPAGLPARPDEWPEGQPWPPVDDAPSGSDFIIRIPDVIAVGDVTDTFYERGQEYAITIDLGGNDTYENNVGGMAEHELHPDNLAGIGQFALDLSGNDVYDSPGKAQGYGGILLDLDGDDAYSVNGGGQGALIAEDLHYKVTDSGSITVGSGLGLLLDGAGDDRYTARATSTKSALQGSAVGWPSIDPGTGFVAGIFLDAGGDDEYDSPMQGSLPHSDEMAAFPPIPSHRIAMFVELAGDDTYQPMGDQASHRIAEPKANCDAVLPGDAAFFLDADGADVYAGSWDGSQRNMGPDWSPHRNGRIAATWSALSPTNFNCLGGHSAGASVGFFVDAPRQDHESSSDPMQLHLPGLGIRIAGATDDIHSSDYALLIDPGGDDVYENNAGSTLLRHTGSLAPILGYSQDQLFGGSTNQLAGLSASDLSPIAALSWDMDGDDTYRAPDLNAGTTRPIARPPQGLQQDEHQGDLRDAARIRSRAASLSQGAGFLGTGLLVDDAGDDSYEAISLSQGFGFLGNGILWDRNGNDRYTVATDLVRDPAIDGDHVVWEEYDAGRWVIKSRTNSLNCAVPFIPEGQANRTASGPQVAGDNVLFSVYDPTSRTWGALRASATIRHCDNPELFVQEVAKNQAQSNQLNPRFAGTKVLWQDDRNGAWDLYTRDLSVSTNPDQLTIQGPPGSSQMEPWVVGNHVYWQDDRSGDWEIFGANLNTPEDQFSLSDGMEGQNLRPRASSSLVAWERQLGDDVDVVVHDPSSGNRWVIGGPGDQMEPTVAGGVVLYTEKIDQNAEPRLMRWTSGTTTGEMIRENAREAAMDDGGDYAFVGTAGFPGAGGIPPSSYSEIRKGRLGVETTPQFVSHLFQPGRSESVLIQGSAWQAGTGWLLEEGGLDRYDAGWHAQGAAFGSGGPASKLSPGAGDGFANEELFLEHAAHGILLDLEGNDAYSARRYSQGVHFGSESRNFVEPPQQPPVAMLEWGHDMGLLLDVRGADSYRADRASQGYAALVLGQTAYYAPGDGSIETDVRTYGVNSLGIFMDLGGPDDYAYAPGPTAFKMSQLENTDSCHGVLQEVRDQFEEDPSAIFATLQGVCAASPAGDVLEEGDDGADGAGPDDGPQNNAVWRQKTRPDDNTELADQIDHDGVSRCTQTNAARACPPVVHVGGVGADLPIIDQLDAFLTEVGNELLDLALETRIIDEDGNELPSEELRGRAVLEAIVEQQQAALFEVERVEFFVDNVFFGYGEPEGACEAYPCDRRIAWQTDSEDYPDAEYEIRARAHYGLPALQGITLLGTTLGFAENATFATVDNPPRLLDPQLTSSLFSPYPYAADAADHPVITFSVSTDLDRPGREPFGWMQVSVVPDDPSQDPFTVQPFTPASEGNLVTWDGTQDGTPLPTGDYSLNITAVDRDPAQGFDSTRATYHDFRVTMDRTPPWGEPGKGSCVHLLDQSRSGPEAVGPCNAVKLINLANAGGNTKKDETGQTVASFALRFSHDGPWGDVGRVHFFTREPGTQTWENEDLQRAQETTLDLGTGDSREVMILLEDQAGNLECAPLCGGQPTAPLDRGDPGLLDAARDLKADLAGDSFAKFSVDLAAPGLGIDSQEFFIVDGTPLRLTDTPRLGPSSSVVIPFTVMEAESVPTASIRFTNCAGTSCQEAEHAVPLVEQGGTFRGEWNSWEDIIGLGWTEGLVDVELRAEDLAGNSAAPIQASVLLDMTPPHVDDIEVRYPDSRRHAEEGDIVQILVVAHDVPVDGIAVPDAELVVTIDASAVSAAEGAEALTLDYKASTKRFEAAFVIDGSDLDFDTMQAQTFILPLSVSDGATNILEDNVGLILGDPGIGLELNWTRVGPEEVTFNFTTVRPATLTLEVAETGVVPPAPTTLALTHEAEITDLEPGTTYTVRAIAEDPSTGAVEVVELTVQTLLGVEAEWGSPGDASILSGLATLQGATGVKADPLAEPRVRIYLVGPNLPGGEKIIFDADASAGEFAMDLVTDSFPDGVYDLRANASFGGQTTSAEVEGIIIDNTAPEISFIDPPPGALLPDSPESVIVRVDDDWTPPDPSTVTLLVDGHAHDYEGLQYHPEGPLAGLLELTGVARIEDGARRIEVRVHDTAGNPASRVVSVVLDSSAPEVEPPEIVYPDGQSAARPGQLVSLRTEGTAAASRVTVNATVLDLDSHLDLTREASGHSIRLPVPPEMAEGNHTLEVKIRGATGHTAVVKAHVIVDASPPEVLAWFAAPTDDASALLFVAASEEVTAAVSLTAPSGDVLEADLAPDAVIPPTSQWPWSANEHLLAFEASGLEPGAKYELSVSVQDTAGFAVHESYQWRFAPSVLDSGAARGLEASASATGMVRLQWTSDAEAGPGEVTFVVFRLEGALYEEVGTTPGTRFEYQSQPGRTETVFVMPRNHAGHWGTATPPLEVAVPLPSRLTDVDVSPRLGLADETPFRFEVAVENATTSSPNAWLLVDGSPQRMHRADAAADCRIRCEFAATVTLHALDLTKTSYNITAQVVDGGVALEAKLPAPEVQVDSSNGGASHGVDAPGLVALLLALGCIALIRRKPT